MQSGNSKRMHRFNQAAILRAVYEHSEIARKDIAALTGLTPATVTNIVADLMQEGLLVETGEGKSGSGRKPIFLAINRQRYCVIVLELMPDRIVCFLSLIQR